MIHFLYFGLLVVASYAQSDDGPIETINTGRIRGNRISLATLGQVDAFLGIPFAEPISGERRFSLPVAKAHWSDLFNATKYGHGCWQLNDTTFPGFVGTEIWNPTVPLGDDCLNLNVWVPYPRPVNSSVLVWIYGGGFHSGVGSLPLYDGKFLAAKEQIIVVTFNYRVGPFGFLATGHPSAPGNQGLYDQAMALQWVQDNIAAFGGNPNEVTLFGESAGGASVAFHQLSPISRSLFRRAAIQSIGPTSHLVYSNKKDALTRAKLLAEALGCLQNENGKEHLIPDMVKCLQEVDIDEFLKHLRVIFASTRFDPVYDEKFLPEDPRIAVESGNFKTCEMMIGSNTNEGNYFLIYQTPGFSKDTESLLDYDGYIEALTYSFPEVSPIGLDAIAFQYRPWKTPNDKALLRDAIDGAYGDKVFTCPSADFALAYAKAGNQVYYYRFEEHSSNSPFPEWMGVLHGDEIAYIFGIPLKPSAGYSVPELHLSLKMMELWGRFAKTGNPNSGDNGGDKVWPLYDVNTQKYLVLNESLASGGPWITDSGVKPKKCAFWSEYLPSLEEKTCTTSEDHGDDNEAAQTECRHSIGTGLAASKFILTFVILLRAFVVTIF